MTVPYTKPWLPMPDQLQKLKSYGLIINDDVTAGNFLRRLNYYRFSGYGLAFEQQRHVFYAGTTFEVIRDAGKPIPFGFAYDLKPQTQT